MASSSWIDAENIENNQTIEMGWAIKASIHAETYISLLKSNGDNSEMRLTPHDDMLYESFKSDFPELHNTDVLQSISEDNHLKSPQMKERWRNWCMKYEKNVEDYNFGTLLRVNARDPKTNTLADYEQDTSVLVTRVQFYAIEIARNRLGLNNVA
ncbi:hypothetical protein MIR68_009424 [Amoeboaphelidium protococcarum]|nr:hypothetical protein MIR68_009424 [Amoeboaphelidium protococcarum]